MGNINPQNITPQNLIQNIQTSSLGLTPTASPGLPSGPASFTTYQLPDNSNDISVNMSGLQSCMTNSFGNDLLNNCIAQNIKGLNNQNIKYIGPGHNIDASDRVTFGTVQNFQNIEQNNNSKDMIIIYIVFVIIYLIIMFK